MLCELIIELGYIKMFKTLHMSLVNESLNHESYCEIIKSTG